MGDPEITKIGSQSDFFSGKSRKKPLKERKIIIKCLKEELMPKIKEELGEEYTEEFAELMFLKFINSSQGEAVINETLKEYLQRKIAQEQQEYGTASLSQAKK